MNLHQRPTFLVPPFTFPFEKSPPFFFVRISILSLTLARRVVAKASANGPVAPKVLNCARRKAINGLSKVTWKRPSFVGLFRGILNLQELSGVKIGMVHGLLQNKYRYIVASWESVQLVMVLYMVIFYFMVMTIVNSHTVKHQQKATWNFEATSLKRWYLHANTLWKPQLRLCDTYTKQLLGITQMIIY